jgi:hypothetical protein
VNALTAYNGNIFAGTDSGVFHSADNGANWTAVDSGLTNLNVRAFATFNFGNHLFTATDDGVWRRPLSEMVTSVTRNPITASGGLRISHAGPISFAIPVASRVTLTAYAPSGERVAVLLDERLPAGSHERRVDAAVLPPGLYIYRLRAGDYTETRKILLSR